MNETEQQIVKAIQNGEDLYLGHNPETGYRDIVEHRGERKNRYAKVYLHGHVIAFYDSHKARLHMTLAGWPTATTRSRLNALIEGLSAYPETAKFCQHEHTQYFVYGNQSIELLDNDSINIGPTEAHHYTPLSETC